jgi:beta-glucosidase
MFNQSRNLKPALAAAVCLLAALAMRPAPSRAAAIGFYSRYDTRAREILAKMTVDEKIGQMLQPDQKFLKSIDDIEKYHLGSLLNGGDSDPAEGNSMQNWADMYDRYQARALKTRLAIPLIYGVDVIHGHSNVIGATFFPHNIGLGCTRDAALVERIGHISAREMRATGFHWAFSPCITVPQDIRWGRSYEGFGETPDIVRPLGAAMVRGLQGVSFKGPDSVMSCPKHAAGDGGTVWGTGLNHMIDHGDTRVDEATFRRIHLPAYLDAINAGAGTIMPSYSSWNGIKCSANKHLLTDILKNEFGFEGFLISDYNALDEIPAQDFKEQIRQSLTAGMDMFMVPEKYALFFEDMQQLVNSGAVPMSRVDDAVIRILRVKAAMGLLDPHPSTHSDKGLQTIFGSPEHRAVARLAVRESLVLLKNDKHVLPLSKTAHRIHLAGKSADDMGNQCGGWTITWQGQSGPVVPGTTIRQAFAKAVAPSTIVSYTKDGSGAAGADVGVLVIGEKPYAEMFGDRKISDLYLDSEDKTALRNMHGAGIPVVVVLISGRPLYLDDVIGQADAWVAAWLPGSEGAGVTDVLFGDAKPTGKLSFTWPKSSSTSLHRGDSGYQTLFPLGYGLTY